MNDNSIETKFVSALCTQCGGQVEVDSSNEMATCKFCGTTFIVEKAVQNYKVQNSKVEHVHSININGPIKSVLNFVEKQQDKKQQKIDEEKRRIEEEKRRQEEENRRRAKQLGITINELFDKKNQKRNLTVLGIVLVIIIICGCIGILNNLTSLSEEPERIVEINMPASSSNFEGENYQEVIAQLRDVGFTNIQTEAIDDLVLGWFTKDGEVEKVSVNGYSTYSTDTLYPPDASIVVSYHTFPVEEEEKVTESSTSEFKIPTELTETSTPEPTEEIVPTEEVESTEDIQSSAEEEIITINNNEEFLAVLNAIDPSDQIIKNFAAKYAGRTIEFDGNIAYMNNHGDYTTRYDFLIYAWDFSETTVSGPSFQFRDCGIFDLHLIGDNIPDYIGTGDNLHIVAKVLTYNDASELFFLDPISTELR